MVNYAFPRGSMGTNKDYNVSELLGVVAKRDRTMEEMLEMMKKIAKLVETEKEFEQKAKDIITLNPTLWGIAIDFNELYRRFKEGYKEWKKWN